MGRLFNAFIFRLKRDTTFRVTLFIGLGLSLFMALLYLVIQYLINQTVDDPANKIKVVTGLGMFAVSLSPTQNFGITIPVNLVTFTVLEFTQGTIRNKIIAGNSKIKIYLSLYLSGLIFSITLMTCYCLLSLIFGTIFGGFKSDMSGDGIYYLQLIVVTLVTYTSISAFTILISTLFRQIGGSIPLVIIVILIASLSTTIVATIGEAGKDLDNILKFINPLYAASSVQNALLVVGTPRMDNTVFYACIGSNIVYAAVFTVLGMLVFNKRDVK